MGIGGDNLRTVTSSGSFEYGATYTPDGTALLVARRDAAGTDMGYWRLPLLSGADPKQILVDGAPVPDGEAAVAFGRTGHVDDSRWAPRALSSDGLNARCPRSGRGIQLVDMSGDRSLLLR
jgi:hypothetical protein